MLKGTRVVIELTVQEREVKDKEMKKKAARKKVTRMVNAHLRLYNYLAEHTELFYGKCLYIK